MSPFKDKEKLSTTEMKEKAEMLKPYRKIGQYGFENQPNKEMP